MPPLLIPTLLAAAALLGLALLTLGLRGRRADSLPRCRNCRYLLSGQPADDNNRPTGPCPECGADLAPQRAIRFGKRRARLRLAAAGLLLLLIGAGYGSVRAWRWGAAFNWNTVKPVWLLAREASGAGSAAEKSALTELLRRDDENALSTAKLTRLAAAGLACQADQARTWQPLWGDLIESAWLKELLTEPHQVAYIRNMVRTSFEFEQVATFGRPVQWQAGFRTRRGSERRRVRFDVEAHVERLSLNDAAVGACDLFNMVPVVRVAEYAGNNVYQSTLPLDPPPGDYEARIRARFDVFIPDRPRDAYWHDVERRADDRPSLAWTDDFLDALTILPPHVEATDWDHSPEIAAQIRRGCNVTRLATFIEDERLRLSFSIELGRIPVPFAPEVFFRFGDLETAAPHHFYGDVRRAFMLTIDLPPGFEEAEWLDVVLRPSRWTWTEFDSDHFFAGEIVIEGVPLERTERFVGPPEPPKPRPRTISAR